MQPSLSNLNQKAIKAALNSNWEEAIKLNEEILKITPEDLTIKLRLGKALLQSSAFGKAKKVFKEILEKDPINKIAQKNYELAKNSKKDDEKNKGANSKLIMEPGTSEEVLIEITEKGVTANSFSRGDPLEIKVLKGNSRVCTLKDNNEVLLGVLNNQLSRKLYEAKQSGANVKAHFIAGKNKTMEILIECSTPIFKSKKQETKPYVKQGAIDEELEE